MHVSDNVRFLKFAEPCYIFSIYRCSFSLHFRCSFWPVQSPSLWFACTVQSGHVQYSSKPTVVLYCIVCPGATASRANHTKLSACLGVGILDTKIVIIDSHHHHHACAGDYVLCYRTKSMKTENMQRRRTTGREHERGPCCVVMCLQGGFYRAYKGSRGC
jgi:hypothetical protein